MRFSCSSFWEVGDRDGAFGVRGGERLGVAPPLPKKCSQGSPVHWGLMCHLTAACADGEGGVASSPGEGAALCPPSDPPVTRWGESSASPGLGSPAALPVLMAEHRLLLRPIGSPSVRVWAPPFFCPVMSRKPQPKWGLDGILALLRTPTEPTTDAQFSWKAGTEPRSAWACAAAAFPCWAAFCPLLPQPHFWPRVVSPSKGLSRRAEPAALYTPYPNRPPIPAAAVGAGNA